MSALPPKAAIEMGAALRLLVTQSGHRLVCEKKLLPYLLRAHEQKIAAVVAGLADIGILRRLLRRDHHGAVHLGDLKIESPDWRGIKLKGLVN